MCKATRYNAVRKGEITWPDTVVGKRRLVRCPYAYTQPVFVGRDCILVRVDNSSYKAQWDDLRNVDIDVCPDPPFSRHVRRLYNQLVIISHSIFFHPSIWWLGGVTMGKVKR